MEENFKTYPKTNVRQKQEQRPPLSPNEGTNARNKVYWERKKWHLRRPEDIATKILRTCAASILSRWNWHIFPRAETALSYAITLSECSALGCLITTSNLDRASAKIQMNNLSTYNTWRKQLQEERQIQVQSSLPPTRGLNTDPPNSAQTPIP